VRRSAPGDRQVAHPAEADRAIGAIVEASPVPVVVVDPVGTVLVWSPAAERMFGWRAEEVVGGPSPITPDESRGESTAIRSVVLSGEVLTDRPLVRRRRDGSAIELTISGAPVRDERGETVGVIFLYADVTARNEGERRLRAAEQRYRALAEGLPLVTYTVALDPGEPPEQSSPYLPGTTAPQATYVSPQIEALVGYPPDEWSARYPVLYEERLHPDDRESVTGSFRAWLADPDGPWREEYRLLSRDGRVVWVQEQASALHDDRGRVVAAQGYLVDLTEHKLAEQASLESEQRFRAMFDSALFGVFVTGFDGRTVECNDAYRELTGYRLEELRRLQFLDYTHPDDVEESRRVFDELLAGTRDGYTMQTRYVRKDGSVVWARVTTSRVASAAGDAALIGIVEDLTGQREALEALEASEDRYRTLFENANDFMFVLDRSGRITSLNRAGELLTGYSRSELVGKPFAGICSRARDIDEIGPAAAMPAEPGARNYEACILTRDARERIVEVSSRPLIERGEIVGVQGVARDVTERRRLEQQLQQAQKMEAVGQLAGGIAHDFNNLLTAISGYAELLLSKLSGDDALARDAEEIRRAGDRAAALTQQLLAFSRRQVLQPRVIDLNLVVGETESMLRRLIGEDIELVTRLAGDLWPVRADSGQVEQVIVNLAVNARDAMPLGGRLTIETLNVDVDAEPAPGRGPMAPGPYALLAVSDTGVGMTDEVRSHVFEPFFTTKEQGYGTGLGLATVYGIVKQSGGFIWVRSDVGTGACFDVYLPRVGVAAQDEPPERAAPSAGSETVLLAEDEDVVRNLVREILEANGYTVLPVANGAEAVDLLRAHEGPIDLVLTDVVMPKLGGRELEAVVRRERPSTKLLFMSGYPGGPAGTPAALPADLIEKPFSARRLVERVRETLDAPPRQD
jgi:PAS domain S-box-containing protein